MDGTLSRRELAQLWRLMAREMKAAAGGSSPFITKEGIDYLRRDYEVDIPTLVAPFREDEIPEALNVSGDGPPVGSANEDILFLTLDLTPEFSVLASFTRNPLSLDMLSFQFM